ncbi:MAG TPA: hypothetical protein VK864_17015 [Longimicrobiales bacterium]|nr:hypothetical protein [Longimicrobiales bacterium]
MTRRVTLVATLLLVAGCAETRTRPDPFGPPSTLDLAVEILAPDVGTSAVSGSTLQIVIHASEGGRRLVGAGFVARLFNEATLDSSVIRFSQRADTTLVFPFRLPGTLATNTQIDVFGIAFGTGGAALSSAGRSFIVIAGTSGAVAEPR